MRYLRYFTSAKKCSFKPTPPLRLWFGLIFLLYDPFPDISIISEMAGIRNGLGALVSFRRNCGFFVNGAALVVVCFWVILPHQTPVFQVNFFGTVFVEAEALEVSVTVEALCAPGPC